jgi:hypothetical protein
LELRISSFGRGGSSSGSAIRSEGYNAGIERYERKNGRHMREVMDGKSEGSELHAFFAFHNVHHSDTPNDGYSPSKLVTSRPCYGDDPALVENSPHSAMSIRPFNDLS